MQMSNLTSKGQVTIPVGMRRALGLEPGDKVRFTRKGERIVIEAVREPPIASVFGVLKAPAGRSLPDVDVALRELMSRQASSDE